jgi:hypothetical protein
MGGREAVIRDPYEYPANRRRGCTFTVSKSVWTVIAGGVDSIGVG